MGDTEGEISRTVRTDEPMEDGGDKTEVGSLRPCLHSRECVTKRDSFMGDGGKQDTE